MDFGAYEVEIRELWINVFEDELNALHKAGFVQQSIKRPSNIGGGAYYNILLTKKGLRLINAGISALREDINDKLFNKYLEVEK